MWDSLVVLLVLLIWVAQSVVAVGFFLVKVILVNSDFQLEQQIVPILSPSIPLGARYALLYVVESMAPCSVSSCDEA